MYNIIPRLLRQIAISYGNMWNKGSYLQLNRLDMYNVWYRCKCKNVLTQLTCIYIYFAQL